jgi:hypothetical protein
VALPKYVRGILRLIAPMSIRTVIFGLCFERSPYLDFGKKRSENFGRSVKIGQAVIPEIRVAVIKKAKMTMREETICSTKARK